MFVFAIFPHGNSGSLHQCMKIKTPAVYIYIVNGEQGRALERTGKWVSKKCFRYAVYDKGGLSSIVSHRCGVSQRKVTLDFWCRLDFGHISKL